MLTLIVECLSNSPPLKAGYFFVLRRFYFQLSKVSFLMKKCLRIEIWEYSDEMLLLVIKLQCFLGLECRLISAYIVKEGCIG